MKDAFPVYLLLGEEFKRRLQLEDIINSLLGKNQNSMNYCRYTPKETDISEITERARTFPFASSNQVVLISNIEDLKENQSEVLNNYLKDPSPFTHLILEGEKLDKRSKLYGAVKRCGRIFEYGEKEKTDYFSFINRKLRSSKKNLSPQAKHFLIEKSGGNLTFLNSTLDKILLYAEGKNTIDEETVRRLTDEFYAWDSFALADAISTRDAEKALQIFDYLFEMFARDHSGIVGVLNWQFKRLWCAKRMVADKRRSAEIISELNIHPYFSKKFFNQLENFTEEKLAKGIEKLFYIDSRIKQGRLKTQTALESFIVELSN